MKEQEKLILIKTLRKMQGLFFWERGGKQFVNMLQKKFRKLEIVIKNANAYLEPEKTNDGRFLTMELKFEDRINARDFLDCSNCLGEKRIKQLIKEAKL
jgi:hypothetical protein